MAHPIAAGGANAEFDIFEYLDADTGSFGYLGSGEAGCLASLA
nr:hypothetical protein [Propionicimonas sp.]